MPVSTAVERQIKPFIEVPSHVQTASPKTASQEPIILEHYKKALFYIDKESEGFRSVQRKADHTGIPGGWNFIDTHGNLLVKRYWFQSVSPFCHGFARVQRQDGLWNYINQKGQLLRKTWLKYGGDFDENGVAIVRTINGYFNYMNTDGLLIWKGRKLQAVRSFSFGFGAIQDTNGLWNFTDIFGKILCKKMWFIDVCDFQDKNGTLVSPKPLTLVCLLANGKLPPQIA